MPFTLKFSLYKCKTNSVHIGIIDEKIKAVAGSAVYGN